MIKKIILPKKEDLGIGQTIDKKTSYPFSFPKRPLGANNSGFDKSSTHLCKKSFEFNGFKFKEGEVLSVVGTRKFGPMAALEILFRNESSGEKKIWVLHHHQHDYSQDIFEKIG